ncbi:MAG TPA: metalloregulator ArsR/SmtB family transcription factor [Bacteroidota bacterium]|jgi:DNA-binding transcriptional ArsR family regulator
MERILDKGKVSAASKAIHDTDILIGLSETFKVLGDITRLKICLALSRQELCVSDIASLVHLTDSAVSHQLRMMKTMRLVKYRKEGKMTYYMLDDHHIEELMSLGVKHVKED